MISLNLKTFKRALELAERKIKGKYRGVRVIDEIINFKDLESGIIYIEYKIKEKDSCKKTVFVVSIKGNKKIRISKEINLICKAKK